MIKFYYSTAPNPMKVALCLEEMELPYEPIPVDTRKGMQHKPEFLALNPNAKVPCIVDGEIVVFDSNAIVLYLAEKTGKFLPKEPKARAHTVQWLMWQMGGLGPMLGQVHHFVKYNAGKAPYAEERFSKEAKRLYGVLDRQLALAPFVAGEYSIADMSIWPWISRFEWQGIDLNTYPNVKRWYVEIANRPAVQRGYHVPVKQPTIPMPGSLPI